MAMCSLLGGIALANAKLGAVHGLAGVIGGTADVPHGMACAALLAPVTEANVRRCGPGSRASPALDRYTEAARLLTGNPAASDRGRPGLDPRDERHARGARPGRVRRPAAARRLTSRHAAPGRAACKAIPSR